MEVINGLALFVMACLAGLGLILLGTRFLSDGLQIIIGDKIRSTMKRWGESSFQSVFVGALTSIMIQSRISAAVMSVSYAGSGLVNLNQLTLFLAGTAAGTLFSPWIFVFESGRMDLLFLGIGVLPMLYARWDQFAGFGRVIFAFGLMLLGYDIIVFGAGDPDSLLLYINMILPSDDISFLVFWKLIGMALLLSYAIRSTVALLGLTMALAFAGLISIPASLVLTIGFNLGATIPAILTARRSIQVARQGVFIYATNHLLLCLIASVALDPVYIVVTSVSQFLASYSSAESLMFYSVVCIPVAHIIFNFAAIIFSLTMRPLWVAMIGKIIPPPRKKQPQRLLFLGRPSHLAPSLAIEQANQEVKKLSALVHSMLGMTQDMFLSSQETEISRIEKYENITDNILNELTLFISKVLQATLSKRQSFEASCLLQMAIELEKIADCCEDVMIFLKNHPNESKELQNLFSTAVEAYEHIFPSITDQLRTHDQAVDTFLQDLDKIVYGSVKVYDEIIEKGLRQNEMYEELIRVVNSIRRITEGSKSIIDLRQRFQVPDLAFDKA